MPYLEHHKGPGSALARARHSRRRKATARAPAPHRRPGPRNVAAVLKVFKLFAKAHDVDALVKPWRAGNDRDHLGEDSAGFGIACRRPIDIAARLGFWTGQVAEAQGRGELGLAILSGHRQHGGAHRSITLLIGAVNRPDEISLPGCQRRNLSRPAGPQCRAVS